MLRSRSFQAKWAPSIVVGLGRLRVVLWVCWPTIRCGWRLPELRKRGEGSTFRAAVRCVRYSDGGRGGRRAICLAWIRVGGVVAAAPSCCTRSVSSPVPRVATSVTRKIYGGAYIAMNSCSLNAKVFAWPDAEVAAMGAGAAVGILHKKKLAVPPTMNGKPCMISWRPSTRSSPADSAIDIGVVDEKIDPAHTRSKLTQALAEAPARRGRHKNIPL